MLYPAELRARARERLIESSPRDCKRLKRTGIDRGEQCFGQRPIQRRHIERKKLIRQEPTNFLAIAAFHLTLPFPTGIEQYQQEIA